MYKNYNFQVYFLLWAMQRWIYVPPYWPSTRRILYHWVTDSDRLWAGFWAVFCQDSTPAPTTLIGEFKIKAKRSELKDIFRTNKLLEDVCDGVGPPYFYTCIWQCVANNSPVRLPAVTYVLAHYSRKYPMEDQLHLMGHDIGLMVSGLCAAVQDSSVLVQRSALDFLIVCFPMQNKQLLYADMVRLVTAALTTILRRDMSLNRYVN